MPKEERCTDPTGYTRVLIRAEGARVDECDVGGVGVVVDDCDGAGVVADHSDLDAVEPGVVELGDGRDRSPAVAAPGRSRPCRSASTVGSTCRHADGGIGAPTSSCGIATTAPSGPNCQPWYGHTISDFGDGARRDLSHHRCGHRSTADRSRPSDVRHNTTCVPSNCSGRGCRTDLSGTTATGWHHRRSREDQLD